MARTLPTYTACPTATALVFTWTTDGKDQREEFELHRVRPEGVFRPETAKTIVATNGRTYAYGLIPGDTLRYVAWPV